MTRHIRTTIRYDGPALAGHEMDVQDLAPALLALADIIQIANRHFNGDAAAMRVLVNADVEQRCFQIDISLVQSLLEQAKTFFSQPEVATAKEIAEWIGIIGGAGGGLFAILKLFAGRTPDARTSIQVTQESGSTTINITGDGNTISVPSQSYDLVRQPAIVDRAKAVLRPLQREGYESLAFLEDNRPSFEVDKPQAEAIIQAPPLDLETPPTQSVSRIEGVVRIKAPQYEGAAKWALLWNGRAIDADMADQSFVEGFQSNRIHAPPNTSLQVVMTETARLTLEGRAIGRPTYIVEKVLDVMPPPQQLALGTPVQ
jgi:hypothetical protein